MDFASRIKLAFRALQNALRTSGVPQRLDYFFPEAVVDPKDGPAQRALLKQEFASKEWQRQFLVGLGNRGALTVQGNYYSVRNRFQIENLVKGAQNGSKQPNEFKAFLDMVWIAGGGESGGWIKNAIVVDAMDEQTHPEPEDEPEPEPEPATVEELVETKSVVPPPPDVPQAPREPMAVLQSIENMVTAVLAIEEKLAENIIYVRDRGDALHTKVKSLSERIATLESKLEIPTPQEVSDPEIRKQMESVAASVNAMNTAVNSMKEDVQFVVESTLNQKASDRIQQIQSSLARISSEFGALRELALETFSEVPR